MAQTQVSFRMNPREIKRLLCRKCRERFKQYLMQQIQASVAEQVLGPDEEEKKDS